MNLSEESSMKSDARNMLTPRPEKTTSLTVQRMETDLAQMINELRSLLNASYDYAQAIEKRLDGILTPTHDVKELGERLFEVKQALSKHENDLHEVEDFMTLGE